MLRYIPFLLTLACEAGTLTIPDDGRPAGSDDVADTGGTWDPTAGDPEEILVLTDADGVVHYLSWTTGDDWTWSAISRGSDGLVSRTGRVTVSGSWSEGTDYFVFDKAVTLLVGPGPRDFRLFGGTGREACPVLQETFLTGHECHGCTPDGDPEPVGTPLTTACY